MVNLNDKLFTLKLNDMNEPNLTSPGNDAQPIFAEASPTSDPTSFKLKDTDVQYYKYMTTTVQPIPAPADPNNLVLSLAQVYGNAGPALEGSITANKQIVFQTAGDTGPTTGPSSIEGVVDKLISDFDEQDPTDKPAFFYHLGDVVHSFGESIYYYDQFYEPFRDYPAPVLAIPGNHDGLSYKGDREAYMAAFLRNFVSPSPLPSPDAGGLSRTMQIQPGVYFAFDAPFVSIIGIYSNILEDPGVISSQGNTLPLTDVQLAFLTAQLNRLKNSGRCILIAVHHPPYSYGGQHSGSPVMLAEIDKCCQDAKCWPHAILSGHAHNYQRYSRTIPQNVTNDTEYTVPYLVCGNGGHALTKLGSKDSPVRAPKQINDNVVFENYDDSNYGYLRIICNSTTVRIEYHTSDTTQKSPNDFVSVDLATRTMVTT